MAYSPDGKTLAPGSSDKTIKLWDVTTGKDTATLRGYADKVWSVPFRTDGKTLASGSGCVKTLDSGSWTIRSS